MEAERHSMRQLYPRDRLRGEVARILNHQLAAISLAVVPDRQQPSVVLARLAGARNEDRLARIGVGAERKCLGAAALIVAFGEARETESRGRPRGRGRKISVAMLEPREAIVDAREFIYLIVDLRLLHRALFHVEGEAIRL